MQAISFVPRLLYLMVWDLRVLDLGSGLQRFRFYGSPASGRRAIAFWAMGLGLGVKAHRVSGLGPETLNPVPQEPEDVSRSQRPSYNDLKN